MEQHLSTFVTFFLEKESTVMQWAIKLNIAVTAVEYWHLN
jgi:hypothetical protein